MHAFGVASGIGYLADGLENLVEEAKASNFLKLFSLHFLYLH